MIRLYKFLKGYYYVKLSGEHVSRVLNRAIGKRVYIWDLKKVGENNMEFSVSCKGYEIIKDIAEETGASLDIINYNGLDKVFGLMKKRWMFFSAAVTAVVCVLVSASFIWTIDVPEVDYITREEIVSALGEMGINAGGFRKTIDYTAVSNALVTRFDSLIWANVELKGTRLKVSLVPRTNAPEIIPSDVPSDIIAAKDGVVTELTAENGEKKVKSGDTVIKGQVLISGLVPSTAVGTRYVHSLGSVKAKTWTEKTKEQKLYKYEKEFTGNSIKKREIEIPFVKIPLYFQKNIDFYNYESIIEERNMFFITYKEYTYSEYNLKKVPLTLEEAVSEAESELSEQIKNETENIASMKTTYKMIDEETVSVRVLAESDEEIGTQREIIVGSHS